MGILQFITHRTDRFDKVEGARLALLGGCRWIQLRAKDTPLADIERMARQLVPLCHVHQAKLLINDHAELVHKVGARRILSMKF